MDEILTRLPTVRLVPWWHCSSTAERSRSQFLDTIDNGCTKMQKPSLTIPLANSLPIISLVPRPSVTLHARARPPTLAVLTSGHGNARVTNYFPLAPSIAGPSASCCAEGFLPLYHCVAIVVIFLGCVGNLRLVSTPLISSNGSSSKPQVPSPHNATFT